MGNNKLRDFNKLFSFQLDFAWTLDRESEQSIDLGNVGYYEVCMLNPYRCTNGGAISFWLNLLTVGTDSWFIKNALLHSYWSAVQYGSGIGIWAEGTVADPYIWYAKKNLICILFSSFHKSQCNHELL